MSGIKVGVVRGGPSSEYEVSLQTGGEILKRLPNNYKAFDVLLDKNGEWFLRGFPILPGELFKKIDVVFNALHGEFGEDGKIQQIFHSFNFPYTGSSILSSSLAMNKHLSRELFTRAGIKISRALVFAVDDFDAVVRAKEVFNSMPPPWVVKPAAAGSSVGVNICRNFPELIGGLERAGKYGTKILAEEYIRGREATCGVLEDFRGEHFYALPPVEIIPAFAKASAGKPPFFDYEAKYNGLTREICPSGFDNATKRELENIAKLAHDILGCRHYSRADFIVSSRGIYLLEVNTLPGLTSQSLFPKAAAAAGLEFPQLLDHIIKLALNKR